MLLFLQSYLPVCVNILLIILIIFVIILVLRIINFIDRANVILDDIESKVGSLNGLFNLIDFTTNKVESFTNRFFDLSSIFASRILKSKKKRKNNKEKENDEGNDDLDE